ncbi:proline racemase family protein [Agathobacter sp.]
MNFTHTITAIDTHTVGQTTRIITSGIPVLKGSTMMEKKKYLADNYDYIRTAVMLEPRGHADMFGAVLAEPTTDEADMGVIFIDGVNYLNMCGHGTIGVATALVETGMVKVQEPITKITLETPAGLVHVDVKVEQGRAKAVSFVNVPAFVFKRGCTCDVPELGTITFDICFGGSFFAIVRDKELGVKISPETVEDAIPKAVCFLDYIKDHVKVKHPLLDIDKIELVEIYGEPKSQDADCQNMVVLGRGEVDRSPCGTGTCAKLALLHETGELKTGEKFVHESIISTKFVGEIVEETEVGNFPAIIPKITGSAYITGFNQLVIDEEDPVKYGFRLKP